ncbi:HpcH/HpaI aldolase/citrate lyase family protein [Mycolicibacterium mucogenicum]|uniref:CoA ester lyase n=1 Tax=Mycolicibacterium mucogenicum DSM 44124 TaxID=1226753 RepID=A0A8H2J9T2_MYCMU|nr:CoA ester lyase [Mycolicibacterium mucogenicum]QPG70185.1 CoA ester lyase [Mycolicibacterium mucogenicum DSM 44124]
MEPRIENVGGARSVLFVPGDRPDRFAKAAASGADLIVLDLEDAVAPDAKSAARDAVDGWLSAGRQAVVRVNGTDTPWFTDDVAVASAHQCAVMLPKALGAEHVALVARRLPCRIPLIALIETASGIQAAGEICAADRIAAVAFGSIDLSAELGIRPDDRQALLHARSVVVLAAAAGKPAPWDGVTTAVHDDEAVRADAAHAAQLGFGGKLCIHPRQVAIVNAQFEPSPAEQAWAQRVLDAAADSRGSACVIDGCMVDKPVLDRAARLLARARNGESRAACGHLEGNSN